MDKERRKKLQTMRLIITEVFMLIIIILTVIILTFIVMGYHLNENGELEQSGLVQIESIPTDASVTIDGEVLNIKTNTSKILPEGKHTVSLAKDGYTSWEKTFETHSGLLTKLTYPRLYKTERKTEIVKKLEETPELFVVSPSRNYILTSSEKSGILKLLNLNSNDLKTTEIDLTIIIGKEVSELKVLSWNSSEERIIISFSRDNETHFAVVELTRPERSIDLSTTFNLKISDLSFANDYGDRLFILENNSLRIISLSSRELSEVVAKDVTHFSNSNNRAIFVDKSSKISLYDDNSKSIIFLKKASAENTRALISEYIGRFTLALLEDNELTIYRGNLPTENVSADKPLPDPVGKTTLEFGVPDNFKTEAKNQIILTSKENNFSVFDLENYAFSSYTLENNLTFWPDDYTIGLVSDGKLVFRDFDGTNKVTLGDSLAGFPAVITKNDKYLYHLSKTEQDLNLVREEIK